MDLARTAMENAALERALDLAARGPLHGGNPRVGCVLLAADGAVVAEGWHRGAGTSHAEVAALASVAPQDRARLVGGTAVVTLEPCHHTGRTPPCSRALHVTGLARVVHAVDDPNPKARGGGDWLRAQGVDVVTAAEAGLRADLVTRARELLISWATGGVRRRPWLIAKTATTLDGRVAAMDGTSRWITGPEARAQVHAVRAQVDAIVVGTGTVLADDPALTARNPDGALAAHQPLRVVVGERPVPAGAELRSGPGQWLHYPTRDLTAVLDELHGRGMRHVLLEGGPTVLTAALRAGLVDELHAYVAPVLLGAGPGAVADLGITTIGQAQRWRTTSIRRLGDDVLLTALRTPTGGDA